jgi:hypothetical protein
MQTCNEPVYIDRSFYESQIEAYTSRVINIPGVRSVYQMGNIKAPGLSDIDIIVVVNDDFDKVFSHKLSTSGLDQRVFLHGPIVIPKFLAASIQHIFYTSKLKHKYGEQCLQKWDNLNIEDKKFLSVCYIIDFIESRFMQFCALKESYIDKRSWLTRIWSTVHSLYLYRFAIDNPIPENILYLENKIKLTREHWLDKYSVENKIFFDGLLASFKISDFLFNNILEAYYGNPILGMQYISRGSVKKIRFIDHLSNQSYRLKRYGLGKKHFDAVIAEHNPRYLAHLQEYMKKEIKWQVEPLKNDKLQNVKINREKIVTQHASWLAKHAPQSGSMKGYLGIDILQDNSLKFKLKKLLTYLAT